MGEQVQMETARLNSDDRINNLTELYSRDKQVINEFLDNNHDLPSAVIEALALRLITLNDFIKMLDDTEIKKRDMQTAGC